MTETIVYSARDEVMKTHAALYQEQTWETKSRYLVELMKLFGIQYVQAMLKSVAEEKKNISL